MKGFDGSFRTSSAENIVLEISGNKMAELLIPEGEVNTFWEGLLDWMVLARYWEHNREK